MSRFRAVRPLLSAILGSALVLAAAVAAQAGVSAHAAVAAHQAVPVARYQVLTGWRFTGFTYQDSPAGLADCNARGKLLARPPSTWRCILGSPNLGLYNLWVDVV
jgi:hypothetical protein